VSARAGVASGVAFCGAIHGGGDRCAGFTMLSSTGVTLAARLMCAAQAGPCTSPTFVSSMFCGMGIVFSVLTKLQNSKTAQVEMKCGPL